MAADSTPKIHDLAELSADEREALFRALPKTDLHCHLDGSLRVATVAELASDPKIRELAESLGYSSTVDIRISVT